MGATPSGLHRAVVLPLVSLARRRRRFAVMGGINSGEATGLSEPRQFLVRGGVPWGQAKSHAHVCARRLGRGWSWDPGPRVSLSNVEPCPGLGSAPVL
jgi:hypothetical protein